LKLSLRASRVFFVSSAFAAALMSAGLPQAQAYSRSFADEDGTLYPSSGYIRHAQKISEEMTLDQLIEIVRKDDLRTIEDVIGRLPMQMKDQNYVLMYRSRSLHQASPEAPRAILFTPTARFVVTFNGGERKYRGHDKLEVMQYHDKSQSFEFREIEFLSGQSARVSEPNPAKCLECHQSPSRKGLDVRPNWEPYSIWPGAFGSDGGRFSSASSSLLSQSKWSRNEKRFVPQDREFLEEQAREEEFYNRFSQEIAPRHPRYRQLGQFNVHAPTDLTANLAVLNFMRVIRLMRQEKEIFEAYKPALEMAMRCGKSPLDLDHPLMKWHLSQKVPDYFRYRTDFMISDVITYLFEPLGVDTSDWSMDFRTRGRFAFYERFGTPNNTTEGFRYAWLKIVPESERHPQLDCAKLAEKTVANMDSFLRKRRHLELAARVRRQAVSAPAILNRCARCHVDSDASFAPKIPFRDPAKLASLLNETGYPRGTLRDEIIYRTSEMAPHYEQMPPSQGLTSEESKALYDYLLRF
jgi:hypothetical protein